MLQPRAWVFPVLLVYTVLIRLVPYILYQFGMSIDPETTIYPWNFSPLPAICLFGAAFFQDRRWSFAIPLGALLLGDLGIWALSGNFGWAFYPYQFVVYACFAATVLMGLPLRNRLSVWTLGLSGFASANVFFVVTNFGVWMLGKTYPLDVYGLIECYVAALPFYRNYLIATAVFSAVLFGPALLQRRDEGWSPAQVPAAE